MAPSVLDGHSGPEYTCAYDDFNIERHALHTHIIERMLTSPRTNGAAALPQMPPVRSSHAVADAAGEAAGDQVAALDGRPPALPELRAGEQHLFVVVGVPGSGKDTVLKRCLRSACDYFGLGLLDASADLVKE